MASQLGGQIQVTNRPIFSSGGDTSPEHVVGSRVECNDGRVFRYVYCTPTALVAGNLLQSPAEKTNHQNLTAPAAAIGATSVAVTLGATAAETNEFAGGYMVISITPGNGYAYKIKSHPAAAASASLTVTLEDPIEVALTTSSRIDLVHNPYNGVIQFPTTATGGVAGVAVDVISAGNYGWVQTQGPCAVLANGTVAVGRQLEASTAVAGAVRHVTGSPTGTVGYALTGIADTDNGAVYLTID